MSPHLIGFQLASVHLYIRKEKRELGKIHLEEYPRDHRISDQNLFEILEMELTAKALE